MRFEAAPSSTSVCILPEAVLAERGLLRGIAGRRGDERGKQLVEESKCSGACGARTEIEQNEVSWECLSRVARRIEVVYVVVGAQEGAAQCRRLRVNVLRIGVASHVEGPTLPRRESGITAATGEPTSQLNSAFPAHSTPPRHLQQPSPFAH